MNECKNKDKGGSCLNGMSDPAWCKTCNPPPPKLKPLKIKKPGQVNIGELLGGSGITANTAQRFWSTPFLSRKTGTCGLSGLPTAPGDEMVTFPKYLVIPTGSRSLEMTPASDKQVYFVHREVGVVLSDSIAATNTGSRLEISVNGGPISGVIINRLKPYLPTFLHDLGFTQAYMYKRRSGATVICLMVAPNVRGESTVILFNAWNNADSYVMLQSDNLLTIEDKGGATFRTGDKGVLFRVTAHRPSGLVNQGLLARHIAELQQAGHLNVL